MTPRTDYLTLLKRVLAYQLWPEPLAPFDYYSPRGRWAWVRWALGWMPVELARRATPGGWKSQAHTMLSMERMDNIQYCIETVLREDIQGDVIETGVWRGGACIFMRALLEGSGRRVFVADSFVGLPAPEVRQDRGDKHHQYGCLAVSLDEVRGNFEKYGLLDDGVVFLRGWFKDTLPGPVGTLAVLRLDGDMYASTMDVLEALYPRLSVGGFCIIDDYGLPGCRAAVTDYRARYGVEGEMVRIDADGVYWRKR